MRNLMKVALGLGLSTLLVSPALAQGPGGGFGRGGGGAMLLANPGVQKELKLDKEQTDKVEKFSADMREKMQGFQDLSQEERQTKMQEMQKDGTKIAGEILKPEQKKRFDQISLQARGLQAFNDPEVQGKLKITDEQKAKIKTLADDTQAQRRDIMQDAGGDRQAAMKKMTDLTKEATKKAMDLLTTEQKATWKEMTGEPFELQMAAPRRRDA